MKASDLFKVDDYGVIVTGGAIQIDLALFLASPVSGGYVTGDQILIDGGAHLGTIRKLPRLYET